MFMPVGLFKWLEIKSNNVRKKYQYKRVYQLSHFL
jgi:hypothetical protein